MRLPVKITLLLAVTVTAFIAGTSIFLYSWINESYQRQSTERLQQSVELLNLRMESLKHSLSLEMDQLAGGIFTEQEPVLAAMLSQPPNYNREVISFAERIKRRTTLSFLTVLAADGNVLSDSRQPALYGRRAVLPVLPEQEPVILADAELTLQVRRTATFGKRQLILQGGYFLAEELGRVPYPGTEVKITAKKVEASTERGVLSRIIELKDFRGQPAAWISVTTSSGALEAEKHNLIVYSTTLIVLLLILCLLAGFLLSRWITAPLQELTTAATAMASGQLNTKLEERGGGEVEDLIRAFNRMSSELEEKQKLLLQAERVAAWQEIARHLAHEIKNPLTPIRTSIMNLRLCLQKVPDRFQEVFQESSGSILEEVEKLRHLADEFSDFARLPPPARKQGDLNAVVQKCLNLYQGNGSATIQFQPGDLPQFEFDSEQISQVVHNLVQNAVDAAGTQGNIQVSTSLAKTEPKEAILAVQDNGPGMDDQMQRQIFTPYFTTKPTGTGLGLAIVQRIVTEHHGSIHVNSQLGQGTRFEVRLPA
jgi:two-component system, NtrC family, nitrogen regulation sensor histidine kinase NtrY